MTLHRKPNLPTMVGRWRQAGRLWPPFRAVACDTTCTPPLARALRVHAQSVTGMTPFRSVRFGTVQWRLVVHAQHVFTAVAHGGSSRPMVLWQWNQLRAPLVD